MNVERIAEVVEGLAPEQALDTVLAANENARVCLTSSFQAEDMAVLHLLRERIPGVPVLFLDTGYHFPQTYEYRDRMAKEWSLHLVNVLPTRTVPEQESALGILYQTAPTTLFRSCGSSLFSAHWSPSTFGSPDCGVNSPRPARISKRSNCTVSPPARPYGR